MPIAGRGMLLTSMNVPPEHEADFNRWYDREHLAERVAIAGFNEARRYIAIDAQPKYLSLYSTQNFDVLDSVAYRAALANQTAWSTANIGRFSEMVRAVARITVSKGQGRGAALGLVRLRPGPRAINGLRDQIAGQLDPIAHDGLISMHLLESDPTLSRSLTDPNATEGMADWFVLIDATSPDRLMKSTLHEAVLAMAKHADIVSHGTYRLLFDLSAADL